MEQTLKKIISFEQIILFINFNQVVRSIKVLTSSSTLQISILIQNQNSIRKFHVRDSNLSLFQNRDMWKAIKEEGMVGKVGPEMGNEVFRLGGLWDENL